MYAEIKQYNALSRSAHLSLLTLKSTRQKTEMPLPTSQQSRYSSIIRWLYDNSSL